MRMHRLFVIAGLVMAAGTAFAAGPPAKISDLAWMTGTWFTPRTPAAQKLELAEIGDKHVKFKAVTEGSMTFLAYTRGADNSFTIEMGQPNGNVAKLALKAK
jgi:hypothetical protein